MKQVNKFNEAKVPGNHPSGKNDIMLRYLCQVYVLIATVLLITKSI